MEIKEIADQNTLDTFIGSQERSQFLQSWQWGEFQRQLPSRVLRLGVWDAGVLAGSVQVIERVLPLGRRYWYIPRGPVISSQLPVDSYQTAFKVLLDEIMFRAEKSGAMFVKIEPAIERSSHHLLEALIKDYAVRPAAFVQPQDSLYLDITQREEKLLSEMHPKTRYNIKLAERKGVTVRTAGAIDDFESFWQLIEMTSRRDRIRSHSRAYYRDMYRILDHTGFMKMYLAEYQGKAIGANLVVFFGDTATYLHGASGDASREVMAPYLLQWRQIRDAVAAGMKWYDFGGIAPATADDDHRWAGITRFKRGFGGSEVNYVGVYDLILDAFWYRLYRTIQRIRV